MSELQPAHEQEWYRVYGQIALTGRSQQFELEARALGRWYAVEAMRVGEPHERRVAILFFDITNRKQIEVELAESEARFSALADGLPMPVWCWTSAAMRASSTVRSASSSAVTSSAFRKTSGAGWCTPTMPPYSITNCRPRSRRNARCRCWCAGCVPTNSGAGWK